MAWRPDTPGARLGRRGQPRGAPFARQVGSGACHGATSAGDVV